MKPVKPNLTLPPAGYEEVTYAEHQDEYLPLPVIRTTGARCRVISRWELTPDERAAVAAGKDIFLEVYTFRDRFDRPNPLQPVMLHVGGAPVGPGADSL